MLKDCPMCGEKMRLVERVEVRRIPGAGEDRKTEYAEWVCPECDYFEEFAPEENPAPGSTA